MQWTMQPGYRCAGGPTRPSGHSGACSLYPHLTDPLPCDVQPRGVTCFPVDICGPYKDSSEDGKSWDHPSGPPDNLFPRGPFYQGVSETHDEFRNRGGFHPKKFNEYVRLYQEPGLKFDKSITQTDFGPPYPKMPRDRSPPFEQSTDCKSGASKQSRQNLHAKEYEGRSSQPEVYFIDVEPKWDLSTETSDNYVCYQRPKVKNQLKDLEPVRNEIFLERVRETHECCPYGLPHEFYCDVNKCGKKVLPRKETCTDTEKESCLMYPKNYSFPNGYLILPSDCRNQQRV